MLKVMNGEKDGKIGLSIKKAKDNYKSESGNKNHRSDEITEMTDFSTRKLRTKKWLVS